LPLDYLMSSNVDQNEILNPDASMKIIKPNVPYTYFTLSTNREIEGINTDGKIDFEDFEAGFSKDLPWQHFGRVHWFVTSKDAYSGISSAQSGPIGNSETTSMSVALDCRSGHVSFWFKISSEKSRDYLRFDIDGIEQGRWSGRLDWTEAVFPVNEEMRTFTWRYTKDYSISEGDDRTLVDYIKFPDSY
jgi:hypothetical protein